MHPTSETLYTIPLPADYDAAREKYSLPEFAAPAVVAKRADAIVGVIGSHYRDGLHIAGPFVADSSVVAWRLTLLYEEILRGYGMATYVFSVKKANPWIRIVQRMNFIPIMDAGDSIWFKRDLSCPVVATTAS